MGVNGTPYERQMESLVQLQKRNLQNEAQSKTKELIMLSDKLISAIFIAIMNQQSEAPLSTAARSIQQKIVALLGEFRELDQDEILDLQRLKQILSGPVPDYTVQAQLLVLLFEYFESAIRNHFISSSEYQKLETLTQRREEELRTYIRVEQQLRLHVDNQEIKIKALEKFKEDRVRLMKRIHEMETEKLKNEKLFQQRLERLIEERRSSVELHPKGDRSDRHRNSIELNLSKIEDLSRPKKRPSIDRSHIRRGSSVFQHKLSLPQLKSLGNAEDLMEKLGSPPPVQRAKRLQRMKMVSQASQAAAPNPKLQLLRNMNLLMKGFSQKQRHHKETSTYDNFADAHIHRH